VSSETQQAVVELIRQGLAPIPVPAGEKNPGCRDWGEMRIKEEEVRNYWPNGQNIGLLCGEPSGGRVDVDLDADEAVMIAGRFLPPTLTSGRKSRPHSHWWYVSPGAESRDWKDADGSKLVELRSGGRQTLVAPSIHPSGERYLWHRESGLEAVEISPEELADSLNVLATAALVARHLPPIKNPVTGEGGEDTTTASPSLASCCGPAASVRVRLSEFSRRHGTQEAGPIRDAERKLTAISSVSYAILPYA